MIKDGRYELVAQNFGFDLEFSITEVELDMNELHWTINRGIFTFEGAKDAVPQFWQEHYRLGKGNVVMGMYGIYMGGIPLHRSNAKCVTGCKYKNFYGMVTSIERLCVCSRILCGIL